MKKLSIVTTLMFIALYLLSTASAEDQVHWGYSGNEGPEYWGKLDTKFGLCAEGKNQSPIDLTGMIEGELPPVIVNYKEGGNEIINNGHTIQVNYLPGSSIKLNGHQFELKQFHFHSPSENLIYGKSYPMEAHFVHADANGNLAVIALMFKVGEKNLEIEKAWSLMPEKSGDSKILPRKLRADNLLPQNRDFYRFNGSLTTPPCSEGVWWLVMKEPTSASKDQIEKFSHTVNHPNNRPVQPINARIVIK